MSHATKRIHTSDHRVRASEGVGHLLVLSNQEVEQAGLAVDNRVGRAGAADARRVVIAVVHIRLCERAEVVAL